MRHLKIIKITSFVFIVLITFAACKSNNKPETRDIQLLTDSSAYNNNTSSDTSRTTQTNVVPPKGNVQHERVNPNGSHHTGNKDQAVNQSNSGTAPAENSASGSTSESSSTQGTHKKGWSKAAQGAVIGGVGGAIGGAIISKNKGAGAAIGGAVGAAGGYIIGRGKDKKDGRVK